MAWLQGKHEFEAISLFGYEEARVCRIRVRGAGKYCPNGGSGRLP
jgi:hypothetical protein